MNELLVRKPAPDAVSGFNPCRRIEPLAAGVKDPRLFAQEMDTEQGVLPPGARCGYGRNAADDEMKSSAPRRRVIEAKTGADA